MRTIGVIQPSFIPWRGYFDFIHEVDVFVFLDDVQYTVRDWRNRNRIRTVDGPSSWLTIPVKGGRNQLIKDVMVDTEQDWRRKHLNTLRHNYARTPYFDEYFPGVEAVYDEPIQSLSELDIRLTEAISGWLGIETLFRVSSDLEVPGDKGARLRNLVKALGGDRYLSGPSAAEYLDPRAWEAQGIQLDFKDYGGYPQYEQIAEPFDPQVSILDLLFMTGPSAPEYIWGELRER